MLYGHFCMKKNLNRHELEGLLFWDNIKNKPGVPSMTKYAMGAGYPISTFIAYVHKDISKRQKFGVKVGRKYVIIESSTEFLIQHKHTIRSDRANDDRTPTQLIKNCLMLQPNLKPEQVKNFANRTFRKKLAERIKSRPVKSQKTTVKRSQMITVKQQFRWFSNVEKAYKFLRENNTGVCRRTGKSFGELIDHFVVSADETCVQNDSQGELKVFWRSGEKEA